MWCHVAGQKSIISLNCTNVTLCTFNKRLSKTTKNCVLKSENVCNSFLVIWKRTKNVLLLSSKGEESNSDEMEKLYIDLKRASLSPIGERRPSSKREFRASFIKRCKNHRVNEKLHLVRALNSTLKVSVL